MRQISVLAAVAALTACADMPATLEPKGDFVPFSQVMAETEGQPWECSGYDAPTDSCETVSTNERVGEHWESEGRFLVSDDPRVEFRGRLAFFEQDGAICADMMTLQWSLQGAITDFMDEIMRAQLEREITNRGVICTRYYRDNDGYRTVSLTASGENVDDGDITTFHARRPNLRY